ncbi:MAG: hypothetical protein K1X79_04995 [Oligoflexia bacterium]|nr:hypothetical protein [Oligoflexia bacterium]
MKAKFVFFIYLLLFLALTWPAILDARSSFWGASSDELQAVWNLWWTHKAIVDLGISPYFTQWLHFPSGISLLAHPLALPHGLLYIILAPALSPAEICTLIVLLGFAGSALVGFLIARDLNLSTPAALFSGYAASFSNYHFLHLRGHYEFVSLELLLLWLWLLPRFLNRPSRRQAIVAAFALFAVALLNYYYFVAAGISALVIVATHAASRPNINATVVRSYLTLMGATLATSGTYVWYFFRSIVAEPLLGGHSVQLGSLHPVEAIVPGRFWRFSELSNQVWSNLPGYEYEHSVGLGLGLVIMTGIAARTKVLRNSWELRAWAWIFVVALWLSFGPLVPSGIEGLHLPSLYAVLDGLFPFSRLSGVPARLFVLSTIAAALLAGVAVQELLKQKRRVLVALLALIVVIENLPQPIQMSNPSIPSIITDLRQEVIPSGFALLDAVNRGPLQLYYQTVHEKPMAFGYTARITKRVNKQNRAIRRLIGKGAAAELCEQYHFSHALLTPQQAQRFVGLGAPILQTDGQGLYKLCSSEATV